jgi:hypothetical protein
MTGQMNAKQLANALRSRAWVEQDPVERSVLEQAADALDKKTKRGPKTNKHLQRQRDIVLVERYHEIKRKLEANGSNDPVGQAFETLATELELKNRESARRIYERAKSRSSLGPPGQD